MVHGETVSEPVIPGTNRAAIAAGCDILAHPGLISKEDAIFAAKNGVYLELTTRKSHSATNKRLVGIARSTGAKLVLDNDAHSDRDLVSDKKAINILSKLGLKKLEIDRIFDNSRSIVKEIDI